MGVAGDLFVHLLSGLHYATRSTGPTRVMATGGLRYWKGGRDVPDVMLALVDWAAAGDSIAVVVTVGGKSSTAGVTVVVQ